MEANYAKAFRIIRAAHGFQQSELAVLLDISPSQLSLIESGKRQPSLRVVERLAFAISVPTALITLLASTKEQMETTSDESFSELANSLLRLLLSASDDYQQKLRFDG